MGEGATLGTSEGEAAADGEAAGDAEAATDGSAEALDPTDGDAGAAVAAVAVKVVVPRAMSPSWADFEVQRIVYGPAVMPETARVSCFGVDGSTVPPWPRTVPNEFTTTSRLPVGSRFSVKVATIWVGGDTVDLSAGVIVSSSA